MNNKNLETVDRYFTLVDHAGKDQETFDNFVKLYADDAESYSNDGSVSEGKQELINNLKNFYNSMTGGSSCHFYKVTSAEESEIEVDWAVSAKMPDENVMALSGHNVFSFNENHEISKLVVTNK